MFTQASRDYYRIARALSLIDERFLEHPSLNELAAELYMSKYHFQRIFKRWVGISPSQFMQYLTLEYTKGVLDESRSLLDAAYSGGLSGPGRLHDLFVTFEAVTPGEYKKHGSNLLIRWGIHDTPFGRCLLGLTDRGICHLEFTEPNTDDLSYMRQKWPLSRFLRDQDRTAPVIEAVFSYQPENSNQPFHLHIKGTNFQINVWKALLNIPAGRMLSYQDVARICGIPSGVRAVGQAISRNPVSFLIPCHRVISSRGEFHGYRWGLERKMALAGWEASRTGR